MQKALPQRRVTSIDWAPETRRMQAHFKDEEIVTFFNVPEEDFETLRQRKFLSIAVMQLIKTNKYPFNADFMA